MSERYSGTARSLDALVARGLLTDGAAAELAPVADRFAIGVSPVLAAAINAGDADDPIARQFIPDVRELQTHAMERADPIGDHAFEPVPGLIHRYPDRVLLKVTPVCPVYCRFCFRREMVGPKGDAAMTPTGLGAALDYIRQKPTIREVIMTGGDPFMLSPTRVTALTRALDAMAHVSVLRWHTRMPVADPARINAEFVAALVDTEKAVYVAVHTNHARELGPDARVALGRMNRAGIVLLGQSVLLRGVNDDVASLADLFQTMIAIRIRPYYLHQLDFAPGTAHFRVPLRKAQMLVQRLRDELSGLCQPSFVIDIPGGVSKAVASLPDVRSQDDGAREPDLIEVRGRDGTWYPYREE